MENNSILVTGAAGSIGSELVRQLIKKNEVFCIDNNETALFDLIEELRLKGFDVEGRVGDIRDDDIWDTFIYRKYPSYIFHTAALKHVTPMEWNPEEAVKTNVLGTSKVIQAANFLGSRLIFISTDKAVDPHSVMGMTKRIGEIMVKNAGGITVRFANVLGSRGSVIPIWQKQVEEGRPLSITHPDMERYFMTIPQAVELVITAAEIGQPKDLIILDMGKPIKILDLAKKIIQESGQDLETKIIGIRPGESLTEKLMTDEEQKVAIRQDKFWIIRD